MPKPRFRSITSFVSASGSKEAQSHSEAETRSSYRGSQGKNDEKEEDEEEVEDEETDDEEDDDGRSGRSDQDAANREVHVEDYLQKHCIMDLLNRLTATLVYHRPHKPKDFLIEELKKMKSVKGTRLGVADFLDEENAGAIFDTLDPIRRRKTTKEKYVETLTQIRTECFDAPPGGDPALLERRISKEERKSLAKEEKEGRVSKYFFTKQIMKNKTSILPKCPPGTDY